MNNVQLTPPKKSTFWAAVIFALLGGSLYSLGCLGVIAVAWIDPLTFLLMALAFVLLALGNLLKGW